MEKRFVTSGVEAKIPRWLQHLLWFMRDGMEVEKRDYLQVFQLGRTETGQRVIHTQQEPPYEYVLETECKDAVDTKVYIIDDETHVTMLLASEY